jgi:hypothetical protein
VGEQAAPAGVEDREPDHVAGDRDAGQLERSGKRPEDADEREQCHHRREQAEPQGKGVVDEEPQVFSDALIRVVGAAIEELQPVVGALAQPVGEKALVQPGAPFDLQHLAQIQPVHGQADVGEREQREPAEQPVEIVEPLVLDGVVELVVPQVDLHVDPDQAERQADHRDEQRHPLGALLGNPIGFGQRPESR